MTLPEILWFAACVVFAVLEACTVSLVSVWFIAGSIAAFIAACLGASVVAQHAFFILVSGLLVVLIRPLVKKYLVPKSTPTNADRLIGRNAKVIEPIDNLNGTGAVRVDGVIWTARSKDDLPIPEDTLVTIYCIEGAKVYVTPAT